MKKFLIAGNWKMNTNVYEAVELAKHIVHGVSTRNIADKVQVLICPPNTNLDAVHRELKDSKTILGAQNCHYEDKGAFTGEVSPNMLKQFDCEYVIIGHSERRQYFNETSELTNKKVIAALNHEIKPILCIGESLEQRQNGSTFNVLAEQLEVGLKNYPKDKIANLVIAYEPVWAIGTGVSATTEQVVETHLFIREKLCSILGDNAKDIFILYGGSLNPNNAQEILSSNNVDGGLIGGASLKHDQFLAIIDYAISI
jgi:triosephosphate isomerase